MKNLEKKNLKDREQYFCYHYINTGNLREAAALAGYNKELEKKGIQLLTKSEVKEEVDRIYNEKKKNLLYKACVGYERLAFGSVADAIRLLYMDKFEKVDLESMDLFNISEIKRPKDGAMEIKFFDRIRALEKLEQTDVAQRDDINPFYYAMEQGIKALNTQDKGDQEEKCGT